MEQALERVEDEVVGTNCCNVMCFGSPLFPQLLFTHTGKEYLTPSHLVEEVDSELQAHAGRITLVELVPVLGVDLNHIEAAAKTLCTKNKNIIEYAGQLITEYVSLPYIFMQIIV